jgi:hypothetical protein
MFACKIVPHEMEDIKEMNLIYANNRLDFITETTHTMVKLFKELERMPTPPRDKVEQLSKYYDDVTRAIVDYFVYLKETDTNPEDSYLSHWLKKNDCSYYYDEIEYFLNGPSE